MMCRLFFFNDTATTEIYTLSLHDALPISPGPERLSPGRLPVARREAAMDFLQPTSWADALAVRAERLDAVTIAGGTEDRKSTRLNSSHANISYAVFCLKKKKKIHKSYTMT